MDVLEPILLSGGYKWAESRVQIHRQRSIGDLKPRGFIGRLLRRDESLCRQRGHVVRLAEAYGLRELCGYIGNPQDSVTWLSG